MKRPHLSLLGGLTFLSVALLGAPRPAQAETLVQWNMSGNTGSESSEPPALTAAGVTGGTLTRVGLSPNAGGGSLNSAGWSTQSGGRSTGYVTFTLNLGSDVWQLDTIAGTSQSSNTGPGLMGLYYNAGGGNFVQLGTWDPGNGSSAPFSLNLSSAPTLTGTVEFRFYAVGSTAQSGSPIGSAGTWRLGTNANTVVTLSAHKVEANSSILTVPTAASVGRVMQGSNTTTNITVTRTGTGDANYSTTTENASAPSSGTLTGAGGSVAVGVDTAVTGVQSGTVTFTNTSNPADTAANKTVSLTGTVVADRTIAGTAEVGKVFAGSLVSGTATLTTSGDSDHFTSVTVNGTAVTQGNASVAAGTSTLFDDGGVTADREISGTFSQSGLGQTLSVALDVTGEGLAGENAGATASLRADVYQHASLVANTAETLDDGGFVTVMNEFSDDGGLRAAAVITGKSTIGSGWSAGDFEGGVAPGIIAEAEEVSTTVAFDRTDKLNGTHVGSLVVDFADEAGIAGGGSLGSRTWTLSTAVSGNIAQAGVAQRATVLAGNSYAGFNTTLGSGSATEVAVRAGIASGNAEMTMTFSDIVPGTLLEASNDSSRVSAILSLEGTGGDTIVLQMSYADGSFDESTVALAWLPSGGDEWVLATSGNSGFGSLAGNHAMSFDAFLAANGGVFDATAMLGAYGYDSDTNTAWAVINHNSDFAVVTQAIPEPGSLGLLALAGAAALCRRRRNRR